MYDYIVSVSFCGFIGAETEYDVTAENEEDAIELALDAAFDDLEVEDESQIDEQEWEFTISFAGFIGAEESYTAIGRTYDEAKEAALLQAYDDLEGEIVDEDEEDDEDQF